MERTPKEEYYDTNGRCTAMPLREAWSVFPIPILSVQDKNSTAVQVCRGTFFFRLCSPPRDPSGSEKGVFWKRGLFRKVHFLEILENLEILEILENPQTLENKGDFQKSPFSRDSREFRDFRDSRDFSSGKTPFVMTPFSGPESGSRVL